MADQATALQLVLAEETINFALAALANILFAGVTFILYGLVVAWSRTYPCWLGWIVALAGAGSILAGLVQAADAQRVLLTLVEPGDEPVERHRQLEPARAHRTLLGFRGSRDGHSS